jgi:hypothetical protein
MRFTATVQDKAGKIVRSAIDTNDIRVCRPCLKACERGAGGIGHHAERLRTPSISTENQLCLRHHVIALVHSQMY